LEGTEAERRRRKNRGAKGAEKGRDWGKGCPPPQPTRGFGRQRIFGIFEVNRTLLVERIERTVPTKPVSFRKKIHSIDDWGAWPHDSPLNTPLLTSGGNNFNDFPENQQPKFHPFPAN